MGVSLSFLNVSFVGEQSLPSHKPCKPFGALLDELVLVSVLALLFSAHLRAPPLSELFAFDASDARAGGCRAPVSEDQWRSLYDLSKERGEHVRLDWSSQLPDPVFSDTRTAVGWSALSLPWEPFFSCAFKAHKHINLLEIESALSLLRHLASEGQRNRRVLALTDSRVALGALSKGRSSSRRIKYLLKKVAALCLCYGFQFDVVWVPTWSNPADAPSRVQLLSAWRNALPKLPPSTARQAAVASCGTNSASLQSLSPRSQASLCIKPLHLRPRLLQIARQHPRHQFPQLLQFGQNLGTFRRDRAPVCPPLGLSPGILNSSTAAATSKEIQGLVSMIGPWRRHPPARCHLIHRSALLC